jgi:benzoyl-CoA reductase subunit D
MKRLTTGIDVGSCGVKCVVVESDGGRDGEVLALREERLRRRDPAVVVDEAYASVLKDAGREPEQVDYVATTGEGDWVTYRTGHFYGMTTHARGAVFLDPDARAALDVGGLHARAVLMDERSKVLGYRMTSQCASGSGQFLENISRYLGVRLAEVGELSLNSKAPEKPSGICAVLAETDVINMVSRGIRTEDILKGIHVSMGERYARLLRSVKAKGVVFMTGGLSRDLGLLQGLREQMEVQGVEAELRTHADAVHAGAIGAALWGAFRSERLAERGAA